MGPIPSPDAARDPLPTPQTLHPGTGLGADHATLLDIARASIAHGLHEGGPLPVDVESLSPALRQPRAAFVTLHLEGRLRGCIGSLEVTRPLAADVARNAYGAAFHDPRFPPLTAEEFPRLDIHLSILSPAVPMTFTSEDDLLRRLRPGVDGLILIERGAGGYADRRATFLPAVWETVPGPREFFQHLKLKAGLPADYWSATLRVLRYTTESVP